MKETLHCNGYPERFFFRLECHQSSKDTEDKDDPRSCVTIPYIQGVSEAVTRILSDINVQVHMKPEVGSNDGQVGHSFTRSRDFHSECR